MHVVATAGHVDHGKSTLVKALTGTDPDRFAEEKARGLTIDLGFAWTTLASGRDLAFVDVPGHVRFLKNMLAGVGAVSACLFVVAATEGWKPQSEEHLRILELLGFQTGMVALTKVGLVDDETRQLARMEIEEQLAGTFLERAEVSEVDVPTGEGVEALRVTLDRLLDQMPEAVDRGRPRLWIDRVFAPKGAGTVVTGTLTGGRLTVDDELLLSSDWSPVRVRGLQSLGRAHRSVAPGARVAVNLSGVDHHTLARGHALVAAGHWEPTRTFDAELQVLAGVDHDVSRRGAYQAYIGSGEHAVRIRVLGAEVLPPGASGAIRIHLPVHVPVAPGDRFVLRESGRDETVGGGQVLDVAPVLPASKAKPTISTERVVAERGWVDSDLLERLTGERRDPDVGRWVVAPSVLAAAEADLQTAVESAGPLGLDIATLDERHRALLPRLRATMVEGGRARLKAAADPLVGHPYLAALDASPFDPPAPSSVPGGELREMVRRGLVLEYEGFYFSATAVDGAARRVAALLAENPAGFTVAQARDALVTTRKHALPLLGLLDASGVTRRRGDLRVAGPRLPPPS